MHYGRTQEFRWGKGGIKIGHIGPIVAKILIFSFKDLDRHTVLSCAPFVRPRQAPIFFCVWFCIRINWRLNERLKRSDLSPDLVVYSKPSQKRNLYAPLMIYGPDFQGFSLRSINYWHPSLDSPLSLLICDKWQSVSLSVGVGRVMPSQNSVS